MSSADFWGRIAPRPYFDHESWQWFYDVPSGAFTDLAPLNKFGRTTNADSGVATDIWDGANPTEDDDIWVPPTQARTHTIVSKDANDTAGGTGARKIRLYGLRDWTSKEVYEDVVMDGLSGVTTSRAYVIIHRMRVKETGSAGPNVGDITATATTDGTITAMILAGRGQTLMAVYGIPSVQRGYLTHYYSSMGAATNAVADVTLWGTVDVQNETTVYRNLHAVGLRSTGTSDVLHPFRPFLEVQGPMIVKVQASTDTNNSVIFGGFDGVLKDVPQ